MDPVNDEAGQSCAALNCGSKLLEADHHCLFRFPSDPERCKLWVKNCDRTDLAELSTAELKNYVLCSQHFRNNQFTNGSKNKLKLTAVPTIFSSRPEPFSVSSEAVCKYRRQMAEKLYSFCHCGAFCDTVVVVNDGEKINAKRGYWTHSAVMASASDVLYARLAAESKLLTPQLRFVIHVPRSCRPKAVESMLQFLYTGQFKACVSSDVDDEWKDILCVAKAFGIPLTSFCRDHPVEFDERHRIQVDSPGRKTRALGNEKTVNAGPVEENSSSHCDVPIVVQLQTADSLAELRTCNVTDFEANVESAKPLFFISSHGGHNGTGPSAGNSVTNFEPRLTVVPQSVGIKTEPYAAIDPMVMEDVGTGLLCPQLTSMSIRTQPEAVNGPVEVTTTCRKQSSPTVGDSSAVGSRRSSDSDVTDVTVEERRTAPGTSLAFDCSIDEFVGTPQVQKFQVPSDGETEQIGDGSASGSNSISSCILVRVQAPESANDDGDGVALLVDSSSNQLLSSSLVNVQRQRQVCGTSRLTGESTTRRHSKSAERLYEANRSPEVLLPVVVDEMSVGSSSESSSESLSTELQLLVTSGMLTGKNCENIDESAPSNATIDDTFADCSSKLTWRPKVRLRRSKAGVHDDDDGSRPFPCRHCSASFSLVADRSKHERTKHKQSFSCVKCKRRFSFVSAWQSHMKTCVQAVSVAAANDDEGGDKPYLCEECGAAFAKRTGLLQHVKTHRDRLEKTATTTTTTWTCTCGVTFVSERELKSHRPVCDRKVRRRVRKGSGAASEKEKLSQSCLCEECGFAAKSPKHLFLHRREQHLRPFECSRCGKRFGFRCNLRDHLQLCQMPVDNRHRYVCDVCGTRFTQRCNLRRHALMHKRDHPLECSICKKTFNHQQNLTVHMQQKHAGSSPADVVSGGDGGALQSSVQHQHGSKAPQQCNICGKIFVFRSQLIKHVAAHEQVRQKRKAVEAPVRNGPHVCPICNQGFWHTRNLGNHMFVHQEHVQLYNCSKCGRTFNHRRYLTIHETKHRDVPLTCPLCPNSFRSQTRLTIHMKKAHSEPQGARDCSSSTELQRRRQQQQLLLREETTAKLYESVESF